MFTTMLEYTQALALLLAETPPKKTETVALADSLGQVLSGRIQADLDLPPFDKSFMDGYAFRNRDLRGRPPRLRVAGVISAGGSAPPRLRPGEAYQIMTGAPLPPGADTVQMVEKTRRVGPWVEFTETPFLNAHIGRCGSEVRAGKVVLKAGTTIGPQELAVLATFGRAKVDVYRRPKVALVATGDELVDITERPGFGQIRNSNAHMLWAQCRQLGLKTRILPVVADSPGATRKALLAGLKRDLLILSGGVSMGEFDYVHKVLADHQIEIFFHKVAIKPGKPLLVGKTHDQRLVFGLPGNPVSSFVTFELFVRPVLRKWAGQSGFSLPSVAARLTDEVRQRPGRLFFKPARTQWTGEEFQTQPLETAGSADIVAFAGADSLLQVPADCSRLKEGTLVQTLLLPGNSHHHWATQ